MISRERKEIGGGNTGAQTQKENKLKCLSHQLREKTIGRASVREGMIPSSEHEIYRRL
jgi:hypothetical protein